MITADTITDEQIRELWCEALDTGDRDLVKTVQLAVGFWRSRSEHLADDQAASERHDARARCAEILNARAAKANTCEECGFAQTILGRKVTRKHAPSCSRAVGEAGAK